MRLSSGQKDILLAMWSGAALKSHRTMDGDKAYSLHSLDGRPAQTLSRRAVEGLLRRGLIRSNQKFPTATFLLTGRGYAAAESLGASGPPPLSGS